jgi:pyruvate,water dikinase
MKESQGSRLVIPVHECMASDVATVGGKAANLGELMGQGLPVPDGFAVTTEAYAEAASGLDLSGRAERLVDASTQASEAADLRAELAAATVSPRLVAEIASSYAALGEGQVAVRSSATAEDLPGATFAGQQDTFLGVVGVDEVINAVRRCWSSLWTDRAVAYRARLGIDPQQVRIAVVVQRMVDADVAGVMFTANPVTGERGETTIDASPGLGEAVVSGEVTPDHFVVDRASRVRDWTAGRGAGTHDLPSAPEPVLDESQVARLASLGATIAAHFGRPQDIEWAFKGREAWILQARPMTALPPPPQRLNPIQRVLSTVLSDYITARPYPIDMTTWVPHGAVGMMAQITADIGVTHVFESFFHESDGIVDGAQIPTPRPHLRLLTAPARLVRRASRHPLDRWQSDPRTIELVRLVDDLDSLAVDNLSWDDLRVVPRRALEAVRPVTGLRRDYLPAAVIGLARLAVTLRVRRRAALLPELLHGAPTLTTRANDALMELGCIAERHPETAQAVTAGDLEGARRDGTFTAAFDDWLRTFGSRETTTPILITTPTLGELPQTVLTLVRILMEDPPPRANRDPLADLLAATPTPRGRARWRDRVEAARLGVAFREDTHVLFTRPMPVLRRALLEMGRRLVEAGVLAAPEDVYHCRLDELEALPRPNGREAQALTSVVARRAARRAELDGVPMLNMARPPARLQGDEILTGLSAGGGEVTARVRVIHGPEEFGNLRAGEILVCPYTNPTWTPLFQRAAGVVVDSGGPASHAAIVAREYGLPAVMGTGNGTTVLHDGDRVRVDGLGGVVTAPRDDLGET